MGVNTVTPPSEFSALEKGSSSRTAKLRRSS